MKKHSSAAGAAIIALVAVASTSGAHAADLVPLALPAEPAIEYATQDYWSGFYAGIFAGRGLVEADSRWTGPYNVGVRAGYTQQFYNFVVGGELEGTYNNKQDYLLGGGGILRQTYSTAAKLRAGVAVDRVLLYGTAGVGLAYLESEGTVTSPDKWVYGLTFGAGAEVAIVDNISASLEYSQTRYSGVSSVIGGVSGKDDLTSHAVKVGLNFHF